MRKHWQLIVALVLAVVAAGAITFHIYEDEFTDVVYRIKTTGPLAVHHVADGDTVILVPRFGKPVSVRLLGINTKEIEHKGRNIQVECYGPEAARYVTKLAEGKVASLTFDPLKSVTEDHDRLLGYIRIYNGYFAYWFDVLGVGGIDLNLHLIQTGFAEEWLYQGRYSRADEFLAAEQKAKAENVGGWKACKDFKKHPRPGSVPRAKRKRHSED